ncbi:copper-binding protein [Inhella proteolytica]|uniref:Copper-binding protein n=1 Tax=Inhella proteolytica TaxID=2795029 RepID=A0A931NG03_9BURK|nr:copper-binding protein [Inhella proteolytica]MBH9576183.1 copper-binding protein [Inhella proteolytica]
MTKTLLLALLASLSLSAAAADLTEAEVKKIDADQAKITLKHGEIKNLDMPPMTMVFGVKDKTLLAKAKPGDKVRVRIEKDGARYVVTVLEAAP